MNDFKVCRDSNSGALLLEKRVAAKDRRAIKFTITFRPAGFWNLCKYWLGLDFPGPTLSEVQINKHRMYVSEKRLWYKTKIVQEGFSVLDPGTGQIRILMNPEDFNRKWKVDFKVDFMYS